MKPSKCAGLILALAGLAVKPASAAHPTMTIRVLDQVHLSASKIKKLEHCIENTLASIKVDVKWIDCAANPDACQKLRRPNEFWLRIFAQMPPNTCTGTGLLGFTQRGDAGTDGIQCVNIFYPMAEQLSERTHVDSHQIIGAAIAHEIGHLYLGTNSEAHSPTGIMCSAWSHRELELVSIGELNFTREQGTRIRAAMSAAIGW